MRKYRNNPIVVDGTRFASKAEAKRYAELQLLVKAGEIRDLVLQPQSKFEIGDRKVLIKSDGYPNGRQASYKADFGYTDARTGLPIIEDVKGGKATRTEAYALRKALVEAMFPQVTFMEVTR